MCSSARPSCSRCSPTPTSSRCSRSAGATKPEEPDFFYAMEYIDGCDGAHFISQWIELKHVLEVYEAAASGLAAAHDKGRGSGRSFAP